MISNEAVDAALDAMRPLPAIEDRSRRRMVEVILEAAAPHMQPDLLEEWAIRFAGTFIEEAESKADAHRRLHEIREAIVDGIESPSLEPMQVVCRYRVASSELTKWKVATP